MINLFHYFSPQIYKNIFILLILYTFVFIFSTINVIYAAIQQRLGFNTDLSIIFVNSCPDAYIINKRNIYSTDILKSAFFSNIYIIIVSLGLFIACLISYLKHKNKNYKSRSQQQKAFKFIQKLQKQRKQSLLKKKRKLKDDIDSSEYISSHKNTPKANYRIREIIQIKPPEIDPLYIQSRIKIKKFKKYLITLIILHFTLLLANIISFNYVSFFNGQRYCTNQLNQVGIKWMILSIFTILAFIFLLIIGYFIKKLVPISHYMKQLFQFFPPEIIVNNQLDKLKSKYQANDKKQNKENKKLNNSQKNKPNDKNEDTPIRQQLLQKYLYQDYYPQKNNQPTNKNYQTISNKSQKSPKFSQMTPLNIPQFNDNKIQSDQKIFKSHTIYDELNINYNGKQLQYIKNPINQPQKQEINNLNNLNKNNQQKNNYKNFRRQAQEQLQNQKVIDITHLNIPQHQQQFNLRQLTPDQQQQKQKRILKLFKQQQKNKNQIIYAEKQYKQIKVINKPKYQKLQDQMRDYRIIYQQNNDQAYDGKQNDLQQQQNNKITNINNKSVNYIPSNSPQIWGQKPQTSRRKDQNNILDPDDEINQLSIEQKQDEYQNWKRYKKLLADKKLQTIKTKQEQLKKEQLKKKQRFQKLYKGKVDLKYVPIKNQKNIIKLTNNDSLHQTTQNKSKKTLTPFNYTPIITKQQQKQKTIIDALNTSRLVPSLPCYSQNIKNQQSQIDYLARQMQKNDKIMKQVQKKNKLYKPPEQSEDVVPNKPKRTPQKYSHLDKQIQIKDKNKLLNKRINQLKLKEQQQSKNDVYRKVFQISPVKKKLNKKKLILFDDIPLLNNQPNDQQMSQNNQNIDQQQLQSQDLSQLQTVRKILQQKKLSRIKQKVRQERILQNIRLKGL